MQRVARSLEGAEIDGPRLELHAGEEEQEEEKEPKKEDKLHR